MSLGSTEQTAYDLRFRLLDVPVRVHPLFWLVMVFISGQSDNLLTAAIFVACAFVSVLVHEMGHGLASRAFGDEPDGIVLHAMGGYCLVPIERRSLRQRFVVLLMGPMAGFLLLALVLLAARAAYGVDPAGALALIGVGPGDPMHAIGRLPRSIGPRYAFVFLLEINFWWGVLNLVPIWPLDGGRIAEVLFGKIDPRTASYRAHVVSLLTAGAIALLWASWRQYWMAIWFGYFALINYQVLHDRHEAARRGSGGWR